MGIVTMLIQDAFAVDHREAGYHHKEKQEVNINMISSWHPERELENLPLHPKMFDLRLNDNSRLGLYSARKIWSRSSFVILRFVEDEESLGEVDRNIERFRTEDPLTIFLASSPDLQEKLVSLGATNVASYEYDTVGYDPDDKDLILMEYSSYGGKILTLPNNVSLDDIELPEVN